MHTVRLGLITERGRVARTNPKLGRTSPVVYDIVAIGTLFRFNMYNISNNWWLSRILL